MDQRGKNQLNNGGSLNDCVSRGRELESHVWASGMLYARIQLTSS